ncbi:uncharacterized protein LOC124910344 [Impatiens glandulifera]|uniref:uncharacterized protein LOC124910344 n=1 Tax=Impatiens glandulifera TaxID=253017 RepID=UPI001FB09784|nr:uncharacterized protein LOC124910344 [Impatiens glandulifera]XP_047306935.1 uncharacterized protein LOC124910344 [Impatiens glandulifera]
MDGSMADQAGKRRLPFWNSDIVAVETNRKPKLSVKPSLKVEKRETKKRKVNPTHKDAKISDLGKIETVSNSEDGDDEEELTIEDLMSIAKEYTRTDETNQPSVNLEYRTDIFCGKNDSESETHLNTCLKYKPAEEKSFEKTVVSPPTSTGDSTQDMLNLFLGPLLTKSQMVEKKLDLSNKEEYIGPSVTENIEAEGLKKSVSEVSVPLEKKRCSLKDKVAMLLQ